MNYIKNGLMGFELATPCIPPQRSTTCASSVVAKCYI